MSKTVQVNGKDIVMDDDTFAALFPVPVVQPSAFTLYKTDIESRMSDAELAAFDTALSAATVRARRLWTDCQMVHSDDPLFTALTTQLTAAFGADRASAILAPTE